MKLKPLFCSICAIVLIFTLSIGVYAQEYEKEDEIFARNSTLVSKTVKDKDGNKYSFGGSCGENGKTASATTSYKVTYIGDGKSESTVNGYTKTLKVSATVYMSGGAKNSYSGTGNKTGAENSFNKKETYLYTVTQMTCTHTFVCNGSVATGESMYY